MLSDAAVVGGAAVGKIGKAMYVAPVELVALAIDLPSVMIRAIPLWCFIVGFEQGRGLLNKVEGESSDGRSFCLGIDACQVDARVTRLFVFSQITGVGDFQ